MPNMEESNSNSSINSSNQQSYGSGSSGFGPTLPPVGLLSLRTGSGSLILIASYFGSLRLVLELMENPPADTPYSALKSRLLYSHSITNFQKIERLHLLDNLGAQKLSKLLAQMLELCPRGQEAKKFIMFL
jgi:hypothetical protein